MNYEKNLEEEIDSRWRKQREPRPETENKSGILGIGRNVNVAGVP